MLYLLKKELYFPPVEQADENGLVAIGGDLGPQRLLMAYRNGIFPWYNEEDPICWWSPDPRCVLFPKDLHISKTMQQVLRNQSFIFSINLAFEQVVSHCSNSKRKDAAGTWIHDEMKEAYVRLFEIGCAYSAEAWSNGELAGGLYGVKLGNVFFGESMFTKLPDASKFAFIRFVQQQEKEGLQLIDCQMRTNHLISLGATMISRKSFVALLNTHCNE